MWGGRGELTAAAESVNLADCSQSAPTFKRRAHNRALSVKNVLNVTDSPLSSMWWEQRRREAEEGVNDGQRDLKYLKEEKKLKVKIP